MILVTGSAGFIGSHLVKALVAQGMVVLGHEVGDDLDAAFGHRLPITAVFHMGAISDTTCEDAGALLETNYELPKRIARFCQQKKIPLIYASSAAVYGNGAGPLNPYALSKMAFDGWMQDKMDFPWYGCRFFNVYGPGEVHKGRQASMVHQMYEAMNDGERPRLFALDAKRDFIHVDDVVNVMLWMWRTRPAYGIYDVGSGQNWSFEELFDFMEVALGISHGYDEIEMPSTLEGRYQFNTRANLDKLRGGELGYSEMISPLFTGIRKFIAQADRSRRPSRPARVRPEGSAT